VLVRPSKGTITGQVWDIADDLSQQFGRVALRREVVLQAVNAGINKATANTQYGHWKRSTFPNAPSSIIATSSVAILEQGKRNTLLTEMVPNDQPDRDWAWLLKNGFTYSADWTLDEQGAPALDRPAPQEPGVYVFVMQDRIAYVGVTARTLRKRMDDYRRGHIRQRTSARLRGLIIDTLRSGTVVRVLFAMPESGTWNGFVVNTALGLESELIRALKPTWNRQGLG